MSLWSQDKEENALAATLEEFQTGAELRKEASTPRTRADEFRAADGSTNDVRMRNWKVVLCGMIPSQAAVPDLSVEMI